MTQREHMEDEVQKWRESGLTKKQFCQQQGIKESTLVTGSPGVTTERKEVFCL